MFFRREAHRSVFRFPSEFLRAYNRGYMTLLAAARSLKAKTVSAAELADLTSVIRTQGLAGGVKEILEEPDSYDGDVYIHDGDLHVAGDLIVHKLGVLVLVVRGNLSVDGAYHDADDPQTIVVVTGDFQARDVVTAGFLEVHGNVVVRDRVIGDYNDCQAWIGGDLTCALFYGEEHFFDLGGTLHATCLLGKPRMKSPHPIPKGIDMGDPRLLDVLDRELVTVYDEDGEIYVDGLKDFGKFKQRVLAGLPLKGA